MTQNPAALIVAVGAAWATARAPHGPVTMWPTAVWLWLTVLFMIRRSAAFRKHRTRIR